MVEINGYTAKKIAEILSYKLEINDYKIDKITINSRESNIENSCFFAIEGEKYDGHNFINEAVKKGAKIIVASKPIKALVPVIYVENTVKALGCLASYHKREKRGIGVTGSVGKTTVKNMIFSLLKQKYKVIATEGNLNNEIGVPLTLLRLKNEEFCVLEMGMRGLNEIDYLASISHPETAIITNAWTSHIERLKTKENIFLAKREILNYNPKYAILPNEKRFQSIEFVGTIPFFVGERESIYIDKYRYTKDGISFSVKTNNRSIDNIKIKSFSEHNLYNALIACKVADIYGLSDEEVISGFSDYKNEKMHEEVIEINGVTIINDCYNASFESVISAIDTLKKYCKIKNKKMNVLLGDILEAGEESEKIHFEIGKMCAKVGVNKVYSYGKYAEFITKGFGGGHQFCNKYEIAYEIIKNLNENDVLLVKASRNMHFEEIINEMKEKK